MGRPRQPIDLLLAKDKKHLTKEEIEARTNSEVKANDDDIFAPSYLSAKLKKRFIYLAGQLIKLKILSNLDVECLARYVSLEEQYNNITKAINKIDIVKNPDEYDKMLIRQTKIYTMLTKSASDLGLTISSRCKLVIPKQEEKPKNKFEKFGAAKNG